MRTSLTIQELLKGRNAGFDSVANQEKKILMTCLPLNTTQGKNGVDFNTTKVTNAKKFTDFLEQAGKTALKQFLSEWSATSKKEHNRAKRLTEANYIVFFWAYDHRSGDAKKPSRFMGVFEVRNTQILINSSGNYELDLKEVHDFDSLATKKTKVVIDWGAGQEITQDFAKNAKKVI